jgi:hypothetical protein
LMFESDMYIAGCDITLGCRGGLSRRQRTRVPRAVRLLLLLLLRYMGVCVRIFKRTSARTHGMSFHGKETNSGGRGTCGKCDREREEREIEPGAQCGRG